MEVVGLVVLAVLLSSFCAFAIIMAGLLCQRGIYRKDQVDLLFSALGLGLSLLYMWFSLSVWWEVFRG